MYDEAIVFHVQKYMLLNLIFDWGLENRILSLIMHVVLQQVLQAAIFLILNGGLDNPSAFR